MHQINATCNNYMQDLAHTNLSQNYFPGSYSIVKALGRSGGGGVLLRGGGLSFYSIN